MNKLNVTQRDQETSTQHVEKLQEEFIKKNGYDKILQSIINLQDPDEDVKQLK